jgi:ribosomal protein S21
VERESSGERKEVYRLEIKVNGNDIERALKLLKRQLQKDGLLKELKQREAQKRRVKSARQSRQNRSVN